MGDEVFECYWIGTELETGMHIGARDIELDDLHRVHGVHCGGDLDIVVDGISCDGSDEVGGGGFDVGRDVGFPRVETGVGETDRVEHPGAGPGDSGVGVSLSWVSGDGFGDDPSEDGGVEDIACFVEGSCGS